MFQPLLDAFIESASIEKMVSKSPPPLKIAVANWWGDEEIKEFKKNILYFILSQRYTITLHQNPDKPVDIVFGNPLGSARKILSYQNAK
ncbi:fucosyltransferase, partial [Helicobacter pylori]